jgi:CelD/BcsL family acetyltransferase involved in cellulose biosynthesis
MLAQKRRRSTRDENRQVATKEWIPDPGWQLKAAFYKAISGASFRFGAMHVSRLRVEADTVATHVGALYRNRFYWLMAGYEGGSWARYSAGRILLESLVEWCIERKVKTFDLTVGDEAYKRQWANRTMALHEIRTALTWKGRLILLWWHIVERARRDPRLRSIAMPLKRLKGHGAL